MGLGHAVDVGKGIALVAQTTGNQLAGGGHYLTREHLPLANQQQSTHVVFEVLQVTTELDLANVVLLSFVDVDRDIDVLLVRRDGNLGGADIHIDIAAVQVIGTQSLQVTGEFFPGVFVVVTEEGQPVGGLQFEQINQVFIAEYGVTDHVDMLNGRHRAFIDIDLQRHAVTRLRNHFGFDLCRVATLGHILALQFVTHPLQSRALEDLAFGQAGLIQALEQILAADRLVALDLDTGNRRPLDYGNHQNIAITAQLDILKEPGLEQFTGRIHQGTIIRLGTDIQRQHAKYAASGNPLQAIDANIGDGEGLGVNFGDHQCGKYRR